MSSDRLLAAVSLILMIAFLVVLVVFVPRIDLAAVIVVVSAMAIYDFYEELWAKVRRDGK